MALSVLNNIPSLVAQDNLAVTNANLQNTLFQLSSGSRINSGAEDPAGLSIANGLQANIGALQQSSQNATLGVGQLQVADGALSQVTTLLNRAVTLATEAANGGLTPDQFSAITNEYNSITSEINRIGQATTFNGSPVFQAATTANPNEVVTMATSNLGVNNALTAGTTTTVQLGNSTGYTYTAGATATTLLGSASLATHGANTTLANGHTITISNNGTPVSFTAQTLKYSGANGNLTAATSLSAADSITVNNNTGTASTYTYAASDKMQALLTALNTNTATNGISAYLDSGGHLVIQGAAADGSLTISVYTGTGVSGALTGTPNTVGDLMTAINTSNQGLTASINANNNFQVISSNGPVSVSNDTTTELGTVAPTNTIQDLINGINGSGLGVTASLQSVSNPNQLRGGTALTTSGAATAITAGEGLTITSGAQQANGTYANTLTYTASATTKDPVTGTTGNNTVQGLIDTINASGTPFRAFLDNGKYVQIIDTSYSGNVAAAGTATAVTGTFAVPAATTQLEITDPQNRGNLAATNNDTLMGFVAAANGNPLEGANSNSFTAPAMSGAANEDVYISDGETNSSFNTIAVQIGPLSSSNIGSNTTGLASANLGTATTAAAGLVTINNAISSVAAMRGIIGAGVNRLSSATNVINTQVQNLTSAQSSVQDANVGQVVANLSKYQVLEQTGIASLAQANTQEQAILRLLP
jgi:flagellin